MPRRSVKEWERTKAADAMASAHAEAAEHGRVEPWQRPPAIVEHAEPGTVTRAFGKFFNVQLRDRPVTLLSTVRGSVRRDRRRTDLIAVGDRVWVTDVGEGEGQIEAVEPRTRVLARLARKTDDIEQVLVANPDQALILFSIRQPEPHLRMLDRFLVLAASRGLPALIGVNKIDLDGNEKGEAEMEARTRFAVYEPHYPVLYLSVRQGIGLDDLRSRLAGRVTVVAGPSGVGKSSLLNALAPELEREIGEISEATGKGRHTTTAAELHPIGHDAFLADTPGIRSLAIHGVPPDHMDRYFPEFAPYLGACFYPDCTHIHEPGCAVRAALESGLIPPVRYESYVALRTGDHSAD